MADELRTDLSGVVTPIHRRFAWMGHSIPLSALDIQFYRLCEMVSGFLIAAGIVFSPWVFGTTETWSIWTMNGVGYTLGLLFMAKWFIRKVKGYRPLRWEKITRESVEIDPAHETKRDLITRSLAAITFLILGYCLISAVNSGATYHPEQRWFEYRHYLAWLPHSFDSKRTWFHFWMYLGLAGYFWAVQDWLSGLTADEESAARGKAGKNPLGGLPARLRALLWLLCINGALLGVEGIVQRASGSKKLLFLVPTMVNPEGVTQFGPYAYRSNAAQYFNLLWPLCLAFWWRLRRKSDARAGSHPVLLICAAIMAACPFISSSRGSTLTAAGMMIIAVVYLIVVSLPGFGRRRSLEPETRRTISALTLFLIFALSLGWYFGWAALAPRMEQLGEGFENREAMYEAARPMTADYPWFGTGPGTFGTVFQFYRFSNATYWPEQLHNDWLETRITFGWIGMTFVLAALGCIFLRGFMAGHSRSGRHFIFLGRLALIGCLIQAVFDFPFQIHSILLLFLILCAILFSAGGDGAMFFKFARPDAKSAAAKSDVAKS